jgi:hypothetical protein
VGVAAWGEVDFAEVLNFRQVNDDSQPGQARPPVWPAQGGGYSYFRVGLFAELASLTRLPCAGADFFRAMARREGGGITQN